MILDQKSGNYQVKKAMGINGISSEIWQAIEEEFGKDSWRRLWFLEFGDFDFGEEYYC